jgi:hypothetical protein
LRFKIRSKPGKIPFGAVSAALVVGLTSAVNATEQDAPWQLDNALAVPDWLSVGGSYRARYETLDNPYRAGASGSDQILVGRLLLSARVTKNQFHANIELEDSRQQLADSGTPLGTDSVNTFEPLQAYVGMHFEDALSNGSRLDLNAGRMTIDIGSRRLVSRNNFRNTINAFTGMHAVWKSAGGSEAQLFYVRPVQRLPGDVERLTDNDARLDTDSSELTLWGIFGAVPDVLGKTKGEAYFYALRSCDQAGIPVADRDIYTPGVRLHIKPAPRSWDFEAEGATQWGTSRSSTAATDTKDLQHRAGFIHGEIGYTFNAKMSPRVELSYDFASGDDDPADNRNNRFDTLYGSRRFDYGPTGIYGAFARSNLSSPGLRIEARPLQTTSGMLGYRAVWLASDRDQYTTARLQDSSGNSGSFVAHQIEAQIQYNALPGNLLLEFGGAYLIHGEFLRDAPGAPREGDTLYLYAAAMISF